MLPFFDFLSLGLIGTAAALGGGTSLIPATICGSISGTFSAFNGQCPAELNSIAAGEITKMGAKRTAGEIVMLSSEGSEYALELLGENFCRSHAYSVMGTTLRTAVGQNQLCVSVCESLPQVAIMSGYESCKVCCKEATITGLGRATELIVDII